MHTMSKLQNIRVILNPISTDFPTGSGVLEICKYQRHPYESYLPAQEIFLIATAISKIRIKHTFADTMLAPHYDVGTRQNFVSRNN